MGAAAPWPQEGVQAGQSVLLSPDEVLRATSKERRTPRLLEARTMRKASVAFSCGRSGSMAAVSALPDASSWTERAS